MPEENLQVMRLEDNYYRDSFGMVVMLIAFVCIAISLLGALSIYLHIRKPAPVEFVTDVDYRVLAPVQIDQPYLLVPDVLQWVSDVLPRSFQLNFYQYDDQIKSYSHYFTDSGWKIFLNQLNNYVNYNTVKTSKLFVSATPTSAPFVLNQGVLSGRYSWWVEMPIDITFKGDSILPTKSLTLQVLVVRVSTLNNLAGVAIDNVIVTKGAE